MSQEFWSEVSRALNEYQSAWVTTGAAVAGVAGLAAVLWLLWPWIRRSRLERARFRRFADANRLNGSERRLLRRLALARFPRRPLLIFVSPSALDAAAAEGLNVKAVREKLFGPTP